MTDILIYSCAKIPQPPKPADVALEAQPSTRKIQKKPTLKEHEYVSLLYHRIDKDLLPDPETFRRFQEQSVNVKIKSKFSLLKDVGDQCYHDLIVQVIKDPYYLGDRMTLWVTDFTDNEAFFQYAYDGAYASQDDTDPYGYTSKFKSNDAKQWPGPFGRKSMQVTCFEPHSTFVREKVRAGHWVYLWNVHIRFGHNNANLEGVLHEDSRQRLRIQVDILDPISDPENVDDRLKEALRRKRDYEKAKKREIRAIQDVQQVAGDKRKAKDEDERPSKKMNSKARRAAKRRQAEAKASQADMAANAMVEQNEQGM